MKNYLYKRVMTQAAKFSTTFFQPLIARRLSEAGFVIHVRLFQSMHAQNQQKQALKSQFRRFHMTQVHIRYHSRFFVRVGHETTYAAMYMKSSFFHYTMSSYVLALQRSLIILVGQTMAWNSETNMIFYTCIHGFMPNSHKKP